MFFFLHRLCKVLVGLLLLVPVYLLYQQRHQLEPARISYRVYKNGGWDLTAPPPMMEGQVTRILNSRTFVFKPDLSRFFFTVSLAGIDDYEPPTSPDLAWRELQSSNQFSSLLLSNRVSLGVTSSNQFSLSGILFLGKSNYNLGLISKKQAAFHPYAIRPLPRKMQYEFFYAQRQLELEAEKRNR
jgi:hypothetical protein